MNNETRSDETDREVLKFWLQVAVFGWFCFGGIALLIHLSNLGEQLGQWGDSFGALNALFSSIAVIGAIYAVVLQQRELKLTREEFAGSRLAQESTAQSQERMARIQAYSALIGHLNEENKRLQPLQEKLEDFIKDLCNALHPRRFNLFTASNAVEIHDRAQKLGLDPHPQLGLPDVLFVERSLLEHLQTQANTRSLELSRLRAEVLQRSNNYQSELLNLLRATPS